MYEQKNGWKSLRQFSKKRVGIIKFGWTQTSRRISPIWNGYRIQQSQWELKRKLDAMSPARAEAVKSTNTAVVTHEPAADRRKVHVAGNQCATRDRWCHQHAINVQPLLPVITLSFAAMNATSNMP
jgi:hypothetical protein